MERVLKVHLYKENSVGGYKLCEPLRVNEVKWDNVTRDTGEVTCWLCLKRINREKITMKKGVGVVVLAVVMLCGGVDCVVGWVGYGYADDGAGE